jgi:hypothetical protein
MHWQPCRCQRCSACTRQPRIRIPTFRKASSETWDRSACCCGAGGGGGAARNWRPPHAADRRVQDRPAYRVGRPQHARGRARCGSQGAHAGGGQPEGAQGQGTPLAQAASTSAYGVRAPQPSIYGVRARASGQACCRSAGLKRDCKFPAYAEQALRGAFRDMHPGPVSPSHSCCGCLQMRQGRPPPEARTAQRASCCGRRPCGPQ